MKRFVAELRRRKVVRAGIAYGVVAWATIEIASATFEPLHLPEWSLTFVIIVAAAGLPLTIVLAWLFDLGPEGLERDTGAEPAIPQAAVAAGHDANAAPSVAVLPFADLSPDGDQAYFCDGIVDEIISSLSRVDDLHVTSRFATLQYRHREASIQDIGNALNVAHVLEGTVRKSGDNLRITAQLVDATNGYHVWSQRFDRPMRDVFAIQDEIAASIAEAMELRLHPLDRCSPEQAGTADSEAYDLYLKGWSYFHRWGARNLHYAAELFQHALDKDADYTRAWAALADTYAMLYIYVEARPEYRTKAREASRRALKLCPKLPESHVSRGLSCSTFANWDDAEQHFENALAIDGEHFEALYFYARACVHQGKIERAIRLFERATKVRPQDYQAPLLLQQLYKKLGRTEDAMNAARDGIEKAEHHLEMNPDDVRALYLTSGPLADLGQLQKGEQVLLRAMAIDPNEAAVQYNAACFYARIGDIDRAVELLEKVELPEMAADWVRNDPDLSTLRGHPRFEELYPRRGAGVT